MDGVLWGCDCTEIPGTWTVGVAQGTYEYQMVGVLSGVSAQTATLTPADPSQMRVDLIWLDLTTGNVNVQTGTLGAYDEGLHPTTPHATLATVNMYPGVTAVDGCLVPKVVQVAQSGILQKNGLPSDSDFPATPGRGLFVYNLASSKLSIRGSGGWSNTALG